MSNWIDQISQLNQFFAISQITIFSLNALQYTMDSTWQVNGDGTMVVEMKNVKMLQIISVTDKFFFTNSGRNKCGL